jgi:hypothetical protein
LDCSEPKTDMKSMEVHFGVIRDKQAIHAALLESKSLNRQLAVCFNSEGKLVVKICTVIDVVNGDDGTSVILRAHTEEHNSEFALRLSSIQSIYPIRDFKVDEPETSSLDWPDDPEPTL